MAMEANAGIALLEYAIEKEEDQLLFARWVQREQYAMSFSAYKAELKKAQKRISVKSTNEILDDVGTILRAFEKER